MKNLTIRIAFIVILLSSYSLKAQDNRAGELMISAGGGYGSLAGYFSYSNGTSSIPDLIGTMEYFIIPNYSVGISASYESVTNNNLYYYDFSPYSPNSYNESLSRFTITVRSLAYIPGIKNPKLYGGIGIGYEFFRDVYSYPANEPSPYLSTTTLMAFVGLRAYITRGFSTYLEVATGTPYYAQLGFSVGIGGKEKDVPSVPATPGVQ